MKPCCWASGSHWFRWWWCLHPFLFLLLLGLPFSGAVWAQAVLLQLLRQKSILLTEMWSISLYFCPHLQQRNCKHSNLLCPSPLESVCWSWTLDDVPNYHTICSHNPKYHNISLHHCDNFITYITIHTWLKIFLQLLKTWNWNTWCQNDHLNQKVQNVLHGIGSITLQNSG